MLKIDVVRTHPDAKLPERQHDTDTGWDIFALDNGKEVRDEQKNNLYIEYDTGLVVCPPQGYYFRLYPRSSISKKHLILANSVGIIDEDYRGPIVMRFKILRQKAQKEYYYWQQYYSGDRIGQLVLCKRHDFEFNEVDLHDLKSTQRGSGGFGSTGS